MCMSFFKCSAVYECAPKGQARQVRERREHETDRVFARVRVYVIVRVHVPEHASCVVRCECTDIYALYAHERLRARPKTLVCAHARARTSCHLSSAPVMTLSLLPSPNKVRSSATTSLLASLRRPVVAHTLPVKTPRHCKDHSFSAYVRAWFSLCPPPPSPSSSLYRSRSLPFSLFHASLARCTCAWARTRARCSRSLARDTQT